MYVTYAHDFGHRLLEGTGIDCEVYPKQTHREPDKPYGNLVKLPFGKNKKTNALSGLSCDTVSLNEVDLTDYQLYYEYDDSGCRKLSENELNFEAVVYDESECKIINNVNNNTSMESESRYKPLNMRPCLEKVANGDIRAVGTGGHVLRCALVPELIHTKGMSVKGIVQMFQNQGDFDEKETYRQVKSLVNYNRFTCRKLQKEAWNIIGGECRDCNLNGMGV